MGIDLKGMRSWSQEARVQRLRELLSSLGTDDQLGTDHGVYDQIVIILLETLREVFDDLGHEVSSLDHGCGIYSQMLSGKHKPILDRFESTVDLAQRYQKRDTANLAGLRAELVTRGMI